MAQAADDGAELQFGFSEHWVRDKKSLRFKSSNLRFAVLSTDPEATPLFFRLEWAGREVTRTGKYVFPGKGAAHPHWQFDGELRLPVPGAAVVAVEQSDDDIVDITLSDEGAVIPVDLEAEASEDDILPTNQTEPRGPLPWFHKLHLPAKALWSELICDMPDGAAPQQHEPVDTAQLESWVISALRYMKHEFSLYSA